VGVVAAEEEEDLKPTIKFIFNRHLKAELFLRAYDVSLDISDN